MQVISKLSIIVPVYYNEDNLIPLYLDIKEKVLTKLDCDYEIIMVDDGSKDNSYAIINQLVAIDSKVKAIKLSRNFGEHSALLAGLSVCTGDCAVRKAADLQEPSEMILQMLDEHKKGNQVVLAIRKDRDESATQKAFSNFYAFVIRKVALPNMPKGGFDSFLIGRSVIDVLVEMKEKNTSLMSQILWSGFTTSNVEYTRLKRQIGSSKWTFSKKVKLFMDSILSFSYFPIKFITGVGLLSFIGSSVWLIISIILKICGKAFPEGYTTLLVLILLTFGVTMLSIGILGEYMWRMFDATRNRPPFIIEERNSEVEDTKDSEN